MKLFTVAVVTALTLGLGGGWNRPGPARGAQPEAAEKPAWMKDPTNAALLYSRAWISAPAGLYDKVAEYSSEAGWKPSAELCKMLEENQDHIDALARAAAVAEADWGVEYSQGFMALLPHLGKLRATARTLACDARCKQLAGDAEGAAERTASLFGAAEHSKSDRLLISALVCVAVHQLACNQVKALIESGTLTEAGRTSILEQMKRFDKPDPFGMRAAILGERDTAAYWLGQILRGPEPHRRLAEVLSLSGGGGDNTMLMRDVKSLQAELPKMEKAYEALLVAWDANDAAGVGRVETDASEGKYGVLARIVMPALSKARQSNEKALKTHADTVAALKAAKVAPAAPSRRATE